MQFALGKKLCIFMRVGGSPTIWPGWFTKIHSNNNKQRDFNTNLSLIWIVALSEEKLCRREGIYTESWPVKEIPRCYASLKNKVHLRQVKGGIRGCWGLREKVNIKKKKLCVKKATTLYLHLALLASLEWYLWRKMLSKNFFIELIFFLYNNNNIC